MEYCQSAVYLRGCYSLAWINLICRGFFCVWWYKIANAYQCLLHIPDWNKVDNSQTSLAKATKYIVKGKINAIQLLVKQASNSCVSPRGLHSPYPVNSLGRVWAELKVGIKLCPYCCALTFQLSPCPTAPSEMSRVNVGEWSLRPSTSAATICTRGCYGDGGQLPPPPPPPLHHWGWGRGLTIHGLVRDVFVCDSLGAILHKCWGAGLYVKQLAYRADRKTAFILQLVT